MKDWHSGEGRQAGRRWLLASCVLFSHRPFESEENVRTTSGLTLQALCIGRPSLDSFLFTFFSPIGPCLGSHNLLLMSFKELCRRLITGQLCSWWEDCLTGLQADCRSVFSCPLWLVAVWPGWCMLGREHAPSMVQASLLLTSAEPWFNRAEASRHTLFLMKATWALLTAFHSSWVVSSNEAFIWSYCLSVVLLSNCSPVKV